MHVCSFVLCVCMICARGYDSDEHTASHTHTHNINEHTCTFMCFLCCHAPFVITEYAFSDENATRNCEYYGSMCNISVRISSMMYNIWVAMYYLYNITEPEQSCVGMKIAIVGNPVSKVTPIDLHYY